MTKIYWRIQEIGIDLSPDKRGLVLSGLTWFNELLNPKTPISIADQPTPDKPSPIGFSIPKIEVLVPDPGDVTKDLLFELHLDSDRILRDVQGQAIFEEEIRGADQDPKHPRFDCRGTRYGHKIWVTYQLTQVDDPKHKNEKRVEFMLEVQQIHSFYWAVPVQEVVCGPGGVCGTTTVYKSCHLGAAVSDNPTPGAPMPQPELYAEVRYKFTDQKNPQHPQLRKIRIFSRYDFDVDGTTENMAMLAKEPITDAECQYREFGCFLVDVGPIQIPQPFPIPYRCPAGTVQRPVYYESPPNIGQHQQGRVPIGGIACLDAEYVRQDFDGYHQGNIKEGQNRTAHLWAPLCTPVFDFPVERSSTTPCLHMHPSAKHTNLANQGQDIHQKFYVVRYNFGEELADPNTLLNGDAIAGQDIVLWYVAESNQVEDRFFSAEDAFFSPGLGALLSGGGRPIPFQYGGLSCRSSLIGLLTGWDVIGGGTIGPLAVNCQTSK